MADRPQLPGGVGGALSALRPTLSANALSHPNRHQEAKGLTASQSGRCHERSANTGPVGSSSPTERWPPHARSRPRRRAIGEGLRSGPFSLAQLGQHSSDGRRRDGKADVLRLGS